MRGRICDIENDGEILHVEIERPDGQIIVGLYELIGWTTPPRDVKQRVEQDIWGPTKTSARKD